MEKQNDEVNMKLSKISEVQQCNRNELLNLVDLIASTTGIAPQGTGETVMHSPSPMAEEEEQSRAEETQQEQQEEN